jgi:hypothetical protein
MSRNSNCFKWIKNSLATLFLICGILSCKSEKEKNFNERLQHLGINITSETRAVLEIGDDGCPNCNQSMVNAFCHFKNNDNVFFLIAVNPNKLDISCFLGNEMCNNIILCKKEDLEKSKREFNTRVFLLKNGVVDSTVHFDANNWEEATEYVSKELSSY